MSRPTPCPMEPTEYKATPREAWSAAAEAWRRWWRVFESGAQHLNERLVEFAGARPGHRVLDVAAGIGEPALTAARAVGAGGSVLATDISPAILRFAASEARRAGRSNITTKAMDGENLELDDASFDVVLSRVGLIYFPDQRRALTEMKRVLVPGGRVAAIVYSTADKNGFFSVPVSIIRRHAKLGPPLPGQPGPFSLGGPGALRDAFERAGFGQCDLLAF